MIKIDTRNMSLVILIRNEADKLFVSLLPMAVVSGVANALLLAIINATMTHELTRSNTIRFFVMYLLAIAMFIITKRYVLRRSTYMVEEVIRKIRIRIANRIRHADLLLVEETGTSQIYARITQDANQISQTVTYIGNAFQALVLVLVSLFYIATISIPTFLVILAALVLGAFSYLNHRKSAKDLLASAAQQELQFFSVLNSVLGGFKEIKINQRKNDNVFRHFKNIASRTMELKVKAFYQIIVSYISSQVFFYVLIAVVIFVLPSYAKIGNDQMIKISAAILFIIGPLDSIISTIPMMINANVAAANILRLEKQLKMDEFTDEGDIIEEEEVPPMTFDKEVKIEKIRFKYPPKPGVEPFSVGPMNITIPKGKIIFITGGNGSGKSTFMKLICGLYGSDEGTIKVDGELVNDTNVRNYRELISIIFTDFFLFERLYGIKDVDINRVNALLVEMGIKEKTSLVEDRLTNLNLSTGQKKRLALVVSILEDKSIFIFDEVAADQDPHFKKFFYLDILPKLKEQGKTIIAVTHDDHYWDYCDYRYEIVNGEIVNTKK